MRIMLNHRILSRFHDRLKASTHGRHDWLESFDWDPARLTEAIADVDVYVGSKLRAEDARRAERLRLVHVVGAGYDGIPMDALHPGVTVATTHHHGRSIAEHVLMSVLMLSRDVLGADRALRAGRWRNVAVDPTLPFGTTLRGRRVGVVGFGETGTEVARLCQAVGMRVRAVRRDPSAPFPADLRPDWIGGNDRLPELLADSDVVVVTVPLNAATEGLIGPAELAAMGPEALLVNVARGPVVQEEALYRALSSGTIAGAALDVWWSGPPEAPSRLPFHDLPNVLMTPHHSGHTADTFAARATEIADNIDRLERGDALGNVVRAPAAAGSTATAPPSPARAVPHDE
ncbi:2-hydroxyacid dehydrogenase [Streptomyces griseoloalbus]|uniref:Phosphoglycerate dehydrogenase-like enzyme n=1 Tax=Streptomyces griseoloalbus TaxID=67303 RepID=A0A7W8BR25_9ACTN|nr:2-hydroxyacid dehydrogenase [Streptomyces albaduncus]MBB5127392.1 phosphoglycerate dehydrogenase-like enzyme [Streptomyces albaduncus]GGV74186.1 2-hydroxyacid dehydrogenase [Streptomyces griseoloalbus]GGW71255.1 2-hydroxyacid dehydrogenase [Streptomyces albaduncus]